MANFGSRLLNTAISSLNAQQSVLSGIANNIANANTPGYARRNVRLENRSIGESDTGLNIGSGVQVGDVVRRVDEFLNDALRGATAEKFGAQAQDDFLSRVENLFSLSDDNETIGTRLTAFFSALNDLTLEPSSVELRSNLIEAGNNLTDSIRNTFNTIANLQQEIDQRLVVEVDAINGLTEQIAFLNNKVALRESNGSLAADERDQRDKLLEELSEKISFNITELDDGTVNVTIGNGLDLVFGINSRPLEVTRTPSFAEAGSSPTALWGGVPSYIVYNYGTPTDPAHVNLTNTLRNGDGVVGGLLKTRGVYDTTDTSPFEGEGTLISAAARIESITRYMLQEFNQTYFGYDSDNATFTDAYDLDGNNPAVYGFFDFSFDGTKDVDGNNLADDLGDHTGILNYSSIINLSISDPRDIAAARDLGGGQFAQGDGSNIEAVIALQNDTNSFSLGAFGFTGRVEDIFTDVVSFVGNAKATSKASLDIAETNHTIAANQRDQISSVNIDEEFTDMIQFQKAFEAAARLIRVASDLLDQIVNVI